MEMRSSVLFHINEEVSFFTGRDDAPAKKNDPAVRKPEEKIHKFFTEGTGNNNLVRL